MLEFTVNHEIRCSAERFWELFLDREFNEKLILDGLGFPSCEVGPVENGHRFMTVHPKLDLPKPVVKLLGDRFSYVEKGTFSGEGANQKYEFEHDLSSTDRVKLGGTVRTEPLGDDKCLRVAKLWVQAKIPMLGKTVEKAAEKSLREGWDKSAVWINEYVER